MEGSCPASTSCDGTCSRSCAIFGPWRTRRTVDFGSLTGARETTDARGRRVVGQPARPGVALTACHRPRLGPPVRKRPRSANHPTARCTCSSRRPLPHRLPAAPGTRGRHPHASYTPRHNDRTGIRAMRRAAERWANDARDDARRLTAEDERRHAEAMRALETLIVGASRTGADA